MEQRDWRPWSEAGEGELNGNGVKLAVSADVEDLFSISTPLRLSAAVVRDSYRAARPGKRLGIDLVAVRFVRLINNPLSIGSKLGITFVEFRLKNSTRRAGRRSIAVKRQHP